MGWNIFAVYGVQLMASGRAAILGYTMPVWSVIIATWLLKEPFTRRRALGCVLGGAGLLLLLGEEIQAVGRSPLGAILMVGAAVSWAIGTIMMKRWPVSLPVSTFTAWQLLISAPPIILFAIAFESGTFNPFALSLWPMLGVFYNAVRGIHFLLLGMDEDRAHCTGRRLQPLGYDDPGGRRVQRNAVVG